MISEKYKKIKIKNKLKLYLPAKTG